MTEAFINSTFDIINNDAIVKILKKLEPKDVLNLCKSYKKIQNLCNRNNVAKILIREHFPQHFETYTPVSQYRALATGKTILYR